MDNVLSRQFWNEFTRVSIMLCNPQLDGIWDNNKRISGCYTISRKLPKFDELKASEWKSIIKKLRKTNISVLSFEGCEAILKDDFYDILRYASKYFKTYLTTNGTTLTPQVCQDLADSGLVGITINLYSADPVVNNHITLSNKFENTWNGIKNALNVGFDVTVHTPLCAYNKDDYAKTIKALYNLGVMNVSCSKLIVLEDDSESAQKLQLSNDEINQILLSLSADCRVHEMRFRYTSTGTISVKDSHKLGVLPALCSACFNSVTILPNGDVVPCNAWLEKIDVMGNLRKDKWDYIWESPNRIAVCKFATSHYFRCPYLERYLKTNSANAE